MLEIGPLTGLNPLDALKGFVERAGVCSYENIFGAKAKNFWGGQ